MRFSYGIFIVAAALEIRVHRPICLANESLLIYGIYELQTLVSLLVHLYAEAIRMFSVLYLNNEDFCSSHSGFWDSLMNIFWSVIVLYYKIYQHYYNIWLLSKMLISNDLGWKSNSSKIFLSHFKYSSVLFYQIHSIRKIFNNFVVYGSSINLFAS